ncbi:MAG: 3'-5' exonuclease [Rhodospirillaceae bacterium]
MPRLDYMIDIETTGTSPDRTGILQIAAVRFDLDRRTFQKNSFNQCMFVPPHRFWEEDTRRWWMSQPKTILENIIGRARPAREVIKEFVDWVNSDNVHQSDRYLWAKNACFDWGFISSYLKDFELANPFSFRRVRDINTFLEGRSWPNPIPEVEVEKSPMAHNAFIDCLLQIDGLFKTMEEIEKGKVDVPA